LCGIVGVKGVESPQKFLIEGFRELEYRGYDSAGIEKGVASTKAFATQVMTLWMLSNYLSNKNEYEIMKKEIEATKVNHKIHEKIKRLSKRYLHGHGFFYIGRDIFYPLALEVAIRRGNDVDMPRNLAKSVTVE
jgi:glucosamine 6-phosphate synthetase-like amidotransferase/phosphosugar isomerase protein